MYIPELGSRSPSDGFIGLILGFFSYASLKIFEELWFLLTFMFN